MRRINIRSLPCLLILSLGLALAPPSGAQETDRAPVANGDISALRDAMAADSSLPDDRRATLSERLNEAARDLEIAADAKTEAAEIRATLDRADTLISDYESRARDIRNAPTTVQRRLGRNPDLPAIEAEIGVVEAQRSDWARQRKDALDAVAALAKNDAELRRRLGELSAPEDDAEVTVPEDASAIGARILQLAIDAHDAARERQRELIELQIRGGARLNKIRSAKIAWLDAAIGEADALLVALREAAARSRESAGEQRRAETRRLLAQEGSPREELRRLADGNLAIIREFRDLSRRIETARRDVAATRQLIEDVQQDAQLTQRRLEVSGLGAELGDVMLSRLASLPDTAAIVSRGRERNQTIAKISTDAIDAEQALRALSDRDRYIRDATGDAELSATERRVADGLVDQRRSLRQENLQARNTLVRLLVDQNQAAEELARVTSNYQNMLTGNLLWVRNYNYLHVDRLLTQLRQLLEGLTSTQPLKRWPNLLGSVPMLACIVLFLIVSLRRRPALRALDGMLGKPIRPRDESVAMIFKGLYLTVVSCLAGALAVAIAAFGLLALAGGDPFVESLGRALLATAVITVAFKLIVRLAGRLGVGRRLLKWNAPKSDLLLRDLRWLRPGFIAAAAILTLGRGMSPTESGGAVGALGSVTMAALLWLFSRSHLRSRLFSGDRLARYALRAVQLLSLAILVMHLSGQLFAAHLYLRALVLSIAAILAVQFLASILQRSLVIYRMGLERKRREELKSREVEAGDEAAPVEATGEPLDAVSSLSEAYTQLLGLIRILSLGAFLWLIWSPALPALSILDSVVLWTTSDPTLPAGELREINLAVLLTALVVVIVTLLVTKHLPPLLNVLLMEWTKVTAGTRYAAGMLLQYLVIGVGFSATLAMLGFQWSKVQWLVAALGVGIGFGLQEIVANFISGLIVLFERPIRVGDIINAGGQDGTVVNINPRATVIETFEGKEVMIPNKELITGTVTNWSLTSSKLRIVVPVGIAYGSDVEDAIERLLRIARGHGDILADPAPSVTFEDFGDNALVLWLRCYALSDYLRVATELRREIYRDFNAAGIGIAFPQRDIHLDATAPLPIRILRDDAATPDGG